MSHESRPILLVECSTRKETQRPSLARSLAAGHKWRACSQANTHALVKPCKYNQDISQQYGTNICNQCKRSTCRSWRVTQVVLATSELATCYESSDIHQSAHCKEESKVHPDENKLCNAAPTNTYQTEQISLYVQNLWLTCELIHQKREQENDFRLCCRPPPPPPRTPAFLALPLLINSLSVMSSKSWCKYYRIHMRRCQGPVTSFNMAD